MPPKSQKSPKKPIPKLPKIPKGANVKVYEISFRTLLFPALFLLGAMIVFYGVRNYLSTERVTYNDSIGLNEIVAGYNSGTYEEIIVQGTTLEARKSASEMVENAKKIKLRTIDRTIIPANLEITNIGLANPLNTTKVTIKDEGWGKILSDVLPSLLGTILFIVLLFFLMGRMGGGGMGSPMAFIKSRARIYDPEMDEKVTFDNVAGADEEKADLIEIVDFLKNPQKYKDLGAKIPRGILLQ